MHSEFHSEMPETQNSPFWAMKVRGPLAQAGFGNIHGVDFGEENLCVNHQDWECKVPSGHTAGRKVWADNNGRGPQGASGSMGLGAVREGAEEHEQGVFHHLFPFPLHPQISSTSLFFSPLEGFLGKD